MVLYTMVSRINSSGLTKTQKLYAIESIRSAILNDNDEEKSRKAESAPDDFADLSPDKEREQTKGETAGNNKIPIYNSVYYPTFGSDFFNLIFTPGDEYIGDIRMSLQQYTQQSTSGNSASSRNRTIYFDGVLRDQKYEMSNYYFVTTEGLHINQYI